MKRNLGNMGRNMGNMGVNMNNKLKSLRNVDMKQKFQNMGSDLNGKMRDFMSTYNAKMEAVQGRAGNTGALLRFAMNPQNWFIITFVSAVVIIYFYYFHNKRIRWFNTSIMISLEPENQDYCKKIANMFYLYLYVQNNRLEYGDAVKDSVYFFHNIESEVKVYETPVKKCGKARGAQDEFTLTTVNFDKYIEEIQRDVFKNEHFKDEEFFKEDFDNVDKDKYTESMEKLINSNFNWSPADKFDKSKNKALFSKFFDKYLVQLSKGSLKDVFNDYMDSTCIFNFVDLENVELNDIHKLHENKLVGRYGQYLGKPLLELIAEIKTKYPENKHIEAFMERNSNNEFYTTTKAPPPITELVDDMVNELKEVFFDFYGIDEVFYTDFLATPEENMDIKTIKCSKDPVKEKDFDSEDDKLAFKNNMEIVKRIERFKDDYDTEHERFLVDYYLLVEQVVYTTFNKKDNSNVFSEYQQRSIINIYQNIVDYVYLKTNKEQIQRGIEFTIHHILNGDPKKEDKLDNLLELYIAIDEFFIMGGKHKAKLEDFNTKRKPDMSQLKSLYECNEKNLYTYFVQEGIFNQWNQYFSGKRPSRYSWIFGKFVDDFDNTYRGLYRSLEPFVENFVQQQEPPLQKRGGRATSGKKKKSGISEPMVVEHFIGGAAGGAMVAAAIATAVVTIVALGFDKFFALITMIPKTLKLMVVALKNITSPFKVIELLGKFLLLVGLTIFKLLMFTIRMPSGGMYLFGEYLLYLLVLVPFTVFNTGAYIVLSILNRVLMLLDTEMTGGLFYRTIYWLVGATENAPASWYLTPGHHYGYDSCNKPGNTNSTECNNSYENKAKRMFFAYYPCGNSYKPDRTTKGFTCTRKYDQEPSYCLQANIYRLKNNLNVLTPIVPDRFVPSMEYLKATKAKRKNLQSKYKQMKTNFYNNCAEGMYDYDALTKNICKLYPSIVNEDDRNKMETLCYNAYCVNGNREPFCYRMTKSHTFANQRSKAIVPRVFVISLYILVLAFLINVMLANDLLSN